ncbi:MAG: hypothetical protein NW216_07695 [Hyphomicrobium sp.]|nr:hypothetical protein [Hyphomicrobium sp.]
MTAAAADVAASARLVRHAVGHSARLTLKRSAALARRLYRPLWIATVCLVPLILIF